MICCISFLILTLWQQYTVKPPYRDILYKGQTIIRKLPGFPAGVENKGGGALQNLMGELESVNGVSKGGGLKHC